MKTYLISLILLLTLATANQAMAALSAVITLSPSTAIINQPITANLAISNTGSAMTLLSIVPTATATGSTPGLSRIPVAFSSFNIGPNATSLSLPANLTTTVPFSAVFFSPSTGITNSGTGTYTIGATFSTSDGSVTTALTGGIATIQPVLLPAAERQ